MVIFVKTLSVTEFKAKCLGLLREVHESGEPLRVTLHGKELAVVQSPKLPMGSVAATLNRLSPLLEVEEEEFELEPRTSRSSAVNPLAE